MPLVSIPGSPAIVQRLRRIFARVKPASPAFRWQVALCLFTLLCLLSSQETHAQARAPVLSQLINGITGSGESGEGLNASVRIGLSYVDDASNSGDYRLEDFDSHIGYQGTAILSAGLSADGYIELGVREEPEDEFGLMIRQLWAGLSGPWGLLRLGEQYSTF